MFLDRISYFLLRYRVAIMALLSVVTIGLGYQAAQIDVRTKFEDLQPVGHPYVEVNQRFKTSFGSSNLVSIMLRVDRGTIFQREVLEKVRQMTIDLQQLTAVNQFQIVSLASKKLKHVVATADEVEAVPVMWPKVPQSDAGITKLRDSIVNNPLIYGRYVSRDLKSTLITVDFIDRLMDYDKAFKEINAIIARYAGAGIHIHVAGDPILFGWVRHYLPQTSIIFVSTIAVLAVFLFLTSRTWRGTLLPMGSGLFSALWALGIAHLLGFNFDPLIIVLAFLISARSISHSVQFVARFDDEARDEGVDAARAARVSFRSQFQPGMLGLVVDAGGMAVVVLTPIPLLQKAAVIGCIWIATIIITCFVLTPILLSYVRDPRSVATRFDLQPFVQRFLSWCTACVTGPGARFVVGAAGLIFVVSAVYATFITIGDARPGSSILRADSRFNKDYGAINATFPGSDRMFVVLQGPPDIVKDPAALHNMMGLQRFIEQQPEIGGTVSIADLIPIMKQTLREGNPRYRSIGTDSGENAELLYTYTSGSEPGDLEQYIDSNYARASVTAFFRDRTGQTIRTAIARIKQYVASHPLRQGHYLIAGGNMGLIAAVNEVILGGQIEAIALALLVVILCCAATYGRLSAGLFFMVPVLLSNTLTFSFMTAMGIGMNINTVPVVALGIGLGVDYSFYIVDRIRESLAKGLTLQASVQESMRTSGWGVVVTAVTLSVAVLVWNFSSLRFQAEMGLLIGIWLFVSAVSALVVVPAMVCLFRPEFVWPKGRKSDEVAELAQVITAR